MSFNGQQAAREIVQRMEGRDLPELIKNLLSKPWANYLVLVLLRQGDQSDEWAQALRFADALIWSVAPKTDDASRTRLRRSVAARRTTPAAART